MDHRRWLGLLVAGLAVGTLPPVAAQAQSFPSHIPLPGGAVTPAGADEFLRSRLRNAETLNGLEELARKIRDNPTGYGLTEEDVKRFSERGAQALADPEMRNRLGQIDPRLADYFRRFPQEMPDPP